jgi:hypothetical protein
MASPISVGDALALARLAIILGRAFTKGRHSAPDEFRDIESQLYSLSAALDALTSIIPDATAGEADLQSQIFQPIVGRHEVESCEANDENYDTR